MGWSPLILVLQMHGLCAFFKDQDTLIEQIQHRRGVGHHVITRMTLHNLIEFN